MLCSFPFLDVFSCHLLYHDADINDSDEYILLFTLVASDASTVVPTHIFYLIVGTNCQLLKC